MGSPERRPKGSEICIPYCGHTGRGAEEGKRAREKGGILNLKIRLICGFLGAGKTTLVKNIIKESNEKTAVLVNDFGNIGIDGELISQVGALNVIELPSGCICCSLRADLDSALKQIYTQIKPERLIIEPTGIAVPSAILETLQGHKFSKFFEIEAVVGIVDPANFFEFLSDYDNFFMNQIMNSDIVLINKTDLAPKNTVKKTEEKIREINKFALIYPTLYCKVVLPELKRSREIVHFHFDAALDSLAVQFEKSFDKETIKELFEEFSSGKYGRVIRAKGIFKTSSGFLNFDYVPKNIRCEKIKNAEISKLVVIGENLNKALIVEKLQNHE